MLGEAAVWRPDKPTPTGDEVMADPRYAMYLTGWPRARRLLLDLIDASVTQGYAAISLSVREANPARRLYESTGFVPVEKHGTSWTMVRRTDQRN